MAERRGTKALEHWCRRMTEGYDGVKIENMTTSWRDGLAFCAMIHHFRPDLINFDDLKKADIYENNDLAFSTAEKYLGIPALLDAADMAAYDVPDRLSILTYLSQFYKVFGQSQNAATRSISKQRSSYSSTEQNSEEQLSTSKESSPKMTPTVGILRRDPCQKCQLPVFLAERMLIGKQVYHRTCLKCARCASQLTPGSFYETEVNNEYCCETCPDEDTDVAGGPGGGGGAGGGDDGDIKVISNNNLTPSHNSISERLAFFEQNRVLPSKINAKPASTEGQEVLESSVSDEEKREHINGLDDKMANSEQNKIGMVYKQNLALSSFLQQTVTETDSESVAQPNGSEATPPAIETPSPRFTVTAQLSLHNEEEAPSLPSDPVVPELPEETAEATPEAIENPDDSVTAALPPHVEETSDDVKDTEEPRIDVALEPIETEQIKEDAKHHDDEQLEESQIKSEEIVVPPESTTNEKHYPEGLNPFDSDDSSGEEEAERVIVPDRTVPKSETNAKTDESLNPFDSSDDEVELEKQRSDYNKKTPSSKIPPPRPPPPQISRNVVNGDPSERQLDSSSSSLSSSHNKKIPLPTPRTSLSQSRTSTPESTPVQSNRFDRTRGSTQSLQRNTDGRGSSTSLPSSSEGTVRSRKTHRAPVAPKASQELFPSLKAAGSGDIMNSNESRQNSPKLSNKKRQAPAPPKPARLDTSEAAEATSDSLPNTHRRMIPLDQSLLADDVGSLSNCDDDLKQHVKNEEDVVYRRILVPPAIETPTHGDSQPLSHNRQLEKLKDNKEAQNRTRQTQVVKTPLSIGGGQFATATESPGFYDKSIHGKWKRRKGPAPGVPIPPRKLPQMLPLQEIRHELEIIEVQQQGLEKQGVILEKMIRDRCEGSSSIEAAKSNDTPSGSHAENSAASSAVEQAQNSKEVEDLILQLFELVNEKNELFRRQAELMYLRRQHRLEQDQADIEYEIRVLMGQPEQNKTDSDKAREELLIARLVEIVELRNEVIDCLETDRLREAEEDLSIKERLHLYNAKRETSAILEKSKTPNIKLSKKEKKQLKEVKKLSKSKNHDLDKDADESEVKVALDKVKKKRKLFF
ncbi:uncharacterized protein Dwil_GK17790 [Drosophila willistoni]|uniref:MICAL-like protein 1 n=1 Tax=Drosophila willistoni TaxID=7260 RepID=B4NPF9_DROWI|nr:MICAL-like protein 1 [Drosophila willistoni]EDW86399.2 uncharacterized protein Dwil_GK17790 [Drosophila willistoni]